MSFRGLFTINFMKQNWLTLLFSFICVGFASAQNMSSIISELNSNKKGQGNVVIYQDESIEGLIGTRSGSNTTTDINSNTSTAGTIKGSNDSNNIIGESNTGLKPRSYIQTKGYKIQVFSGNNQRVSKNEAYSRKNQITREFPDEEVSVTFNSPVWRVRVGNFRTYEQAFETLKEMKKTFPSFGKEMEIKEAVVKLPVY